MRVEPPTSTTSLRFAGVQAGILQGGLKRVAAALEQVFGHLLELGAAQFQLQVLRAAGIGGDVRQVDLRLHHGGKLDLGLLGGFAQALQGLAVLAQVDALLLLELIGSPVHDTLVPVVAAQVRVAVGGLDLDHAFAHFQHGDVERAAAQVEDQDGFVLLLIQAVGQGRGGRLVDDAHALPGRRSCRRLWWPGAGCR